MVKQKVGPIKVTLKFRNVLTEVQPPHRLVLEGDGEDITKLGHMKQKTIVELKETGDGNGKAHRLMCPVFRRVYLLMK